MKTAAKHWLTLRLAAVLLIPLSFYFIAQLGHIVTTSRDNFAHWVKQPLNRYALTAFVLCSFYHASLGMDEIIEDYVQAKALKTALLLANRIFFLGLGAASLYATWNMT